MSGTYKEFSDLLSAYNKANEKWTPIQNAYELLDSVNENEIWEERHAAAEALFKYDSELVAERDQAKEMVNRLIEVGDALAADYCNETLSAYGFQIVTKWQELTKNCKERENDRIES